MTSENTVPPVIDHARLEATLREGAVTATRMLEPESLGVLCRKPIVDEDCPEASDVDLLSIWRRPEEFPERISVEGPTGRIFVDVLWVPVSKMLDPAEAATYKMLPHLLLDSESLWMRSDPVAPLVDNIRLRAYEKSIWERRIGNQIGFGDAALQEAAENLDFPPAVLFFLQTAHTYYTIALADCLKHTITSLMTKPMAKLRLMAAETGCELDKAAKDNLHLEGGQSASLDALDRVFNAVSARCSPQKPSGVSARTRGHYAYTISPLELEYRKSVAGALLRRGDHASANFYIRFWAYSLSRCPVVLQEARQGKDPSFYVPFGRFKESLGAACPEIIEDMRMILGGDLTRREAEESISGTSLFRRMVTDQVRARGLGVESPVGVPGEREGTA